MYVDRQGASTILFDHLFHFLEEDMNMRKITSMTMLISLLILLLNSVILYVVPEGRVAYWADWRFWGLTKGEWSDQHITVGVLFLIAGVLHIYYNWKPIVAYMKNKAREVKVFTGAFNVALAVSLLFVVGTYFQIPPMSTILDISSSFKDSGSKTYGEPPYGHAELSSLKFFAKKEYLDLEKSMELLKEAGVKVSSEKDTLKMIANNNKMTPQQVYEIIKPASTNVSGPDGETVGKSFPDSPAPGWAKKSFEEFCTEYGLKVNRLAHKLDEKGIRVDPGSSIKEIAADNDISPMDIFEVSQEFARNHS